MVSSGVFVIIFNGAKGDVVRAAVASSNPVLAQQKRVVLWFLLSLFPGSVALLREVSRCSAPMWSWAREKKVPA
jgi:hypothetical protein